jgi:hypothetical protein
MATKGSKQVKIRVEQKTMVIRSIAYPGDTTITWVEKTPGGWQTRHKRIKAGTKAWKRLRAS